MARARPRGRKRTAAEAHGSTETAATVRPGRRARAPAPRPEAAEYFPEKRNLEDLWLSAFPIGTEWENIDRIQEFNWNFQNLEQALEEGGELYGRTVYLFGSTEPQLLNEKMVFVPVVVAVDCPFPPSDKVGIKSVQRENEEIVSMRVMKMGWVPYVPLEDRLSRIEGLETKIFTLCCTQRRSALKHLKTERVKKFDYCMPYYMPLYPEDDHDTTVHIIYPLEPPIVCSFDWETDKYEAFVKAEELPEDEKEKFKEFLVEKVRERKRELEQAQNARQESIDNMDPELREAFENIHFYKFYPVNALDAPDLSIQKNAYINRYYGKARKQM